MTRAPQVEFEASFLPSERDASVWVVERLAAQNQLALAFNSKVRVSRRSQRPYDVKLKAMWSDGRDPNTLAFTAETFGRGWLVAECVAQFAKMGLATPVDRNDEERCWVAFTSVVARAQRSA